MHKAISMPNFLGDICNSMHYSASALVSDPSQDWSKRGSDSAHTNLRHTSSCLRWQKKVVWAHLMSTCYLVPDMEAEKRQMYCHMKFVMEYSHTGQNQWQYTVRIPNGITKTFAYTLGQEFDSFTLDGRPIVVQNLISHGQLNCL